MHAAFDRRERAVVAIPHDHPHRNEPQRDPPQRARSAARGAPAPMHAAVHDEAAVRLLPCALRALRGLAPFMRQHLRWLLAGAAGALAVIAARLALPWPLRAVADHATGAADPGPLLALVPAALDPALAMGGVFLTLVFLLGCSDYLQRVSFARFAGATADDVHARALAGAASGRSGYTGANAGELVNRFVADGPRIRSGLQGFLVHVATSALLIAGMTAVLVGMDAWLGAVFLLAGVGTLAVTGWAAARIFRHTLRQRRHDGEFANRLHAALDDDGGDAFDLAPLQRARGSEATRAHLQGIATWTTHAIFGAAILAALAIASSAVIAGAMSAGDLVVFLMYALMLHSPIVRLARQGSKIGKLLGAAHRLLPFVPDNPPRSPR